LIPLLTNRFIRAFNSNWLNYFQNLFWYYLY